MTLAIIATLAILVLLVIRVQHHRAALGDLEQRIVSILERRGASD